MSKVLLVPNAHSHSAPKPLLLTFSAEPPFFFSKGGFFEFYQRISFLYKSHLAMSLWAWPRIPAKRRMWVYRRK